MMYVDVDNPPRPKRQGFLLLDAHARAQECLELSFYLYRELYRNLRTPILLFQDPSYLVS